MRTIFKTAGVLPAGTGVFAACLADPLRAAVATNPFAGPAEAVQRGHAPWLEHCIACHGT